MVNSFLKSLATGLLARLLAYGCLAVGFWLLYRGFQAGGLGTGVLLGLGGGAAILLGMFLMVAIRRTGPLGALSGPTNEEDSSGDPIYRSNQGG